MENKQMTFEEKTKEYREQITSLKEIDSLEVYQWLISLGKKLNENPLSKDKQTQENKVVRCQYDLYVDKEDDTFKAWSNAMVAGGYAYVLVDIFNSISKEEAKNITVEDFKKIKLDEMLTMNRQTGFYEMVEKMLRKI